MIIPTKPGSTMIRLVSWSSLPAISTRARVASNGRPQPSSAIVYVMGNHEYYGQDRVALLTEARQTAARLGVHLLERDAIRIQGQRFLGCTLWSGLDSGPRSWLDVARNVHWMIDDFSAIRSSGDAFTPLRMVEEHEYSVSWLQRMLEPGDPSIVITHFPPSRALAAPRFSSDDALAPYFTND